MSDNKDIKGIEKKTSIIDHKNILEDVKTLLDTDYSNVNSLNRSVALSYKIGDKIAEMRDYIETVEKIHKIDDNKLYYIIYPIPEQFKEDFSIIKDIGTVNIICITEYILDERDKITQINSLISYVDFTNESANVDLVENINHNIIPRFVDLINDFDKKAIGKKLEDIPEYNEQRHEFVIPYIIDVIYKR
jgi:hypothetical protein